MFDLEGLRAAVAARGRVARIVIALVDGSSPREVGAAMLVWEGGSSGTIGGGALEWQAMARAREMLVAGQNARLDRVPLGPALGQCCGGAVAVLTEVYDDASLPGADVVARAVDGRAMPLAVRRLLARARGEGVMPDPVLVQGWFVEPVARAERQLWVWGAGHVGRALVAVLAPLPGLAITWVDVAADRFPDAVPEGVTLLPAADPAALVAHAPVTAEHLVLTYSHVLDLDLCHGLLGHGFVRLGLIGSATKWARFRSRLAALGHGAAQIGRIDCPIGDPTLGKHPQAIAVGGGGGHSATDNKNRVTTGDRGMTGMGETLLTVEGLTKAYPGVVANSDVSFSIGMGEVHALLGENGAGKSTLVKMIYGLIRPDSGHMTLRGVPYAPPKPSVARQQGVAMVFQHFSLFEALDVAENVALGMENPPKMGALAARIREVSEAYGLPLDPSRLVGDLSAGERQRVEIIRCLLQDPKLLIMDEPTSVLTPQEVDILFQTLRQLSAEGTAILYISHKLEEIRSLCDAATILRRGKVVATCTPSEKSARELAELMVGETLTPPARNEKPKGAVALEVSRLSVKSPNPFGTALKEVSFAVQKGEILGIAGVAGNGQDELLLALSGELRSAKDAVKIDGVGMGDTGPNDRRKAGLVAAPEERLGHAAAPDMSLTENALLSGAIRKGLVSNGFIDWAATKAFAEGIVTAYDVRTPGIWVAARALSGGNLQKFVVGRELMQAPSVVVVNQPTWGVDASAAAAIRQALIDRAAEGAAVVVISQDLDELLEIADRFAALNGGRMTEPRPVHGLTVDQIGLMMGGAHGMEVAHVHP